MDTDSNDFEIKHFDESKFVPPRLGRFSLIDDKLYLKQIFKMLGLPLMATPQVAFAAESIDSWI